MIKLSMGLKRLPSLSREQFLAYWTQQHAALVKENATRLGIVRYAQVHGLAESEFLVAGVPGAASSVFDGVAEIWFNDLSAAASSGRTREGREAMKLLRDDERNFIDPIQSVVWWGRLHTVI